MGSIKFSTANKAVHHLGRRLYNSNPPALAELVANSYDAYATKVDIEITDSSYCIVDNGKGLDLDGLREKYAKIGKTKEKELPFNGEPERNPMGQKGIGKLAAFSLGNSYTIYTKTINSDKWITLKLIYDDLLKSEESHVVECFKTDLPEELSRYNSYESGFIVYIKDVIRKTNNNTLYHLKANLSRRFYLTSRETNFQVKLNNEIIDFSTHEYFNNLEFIIYFGYNSEEINNIFPKLSKDNIIEYSKSGKVLDYIKAKGSLKGWLGGVSKPKDLQKNEYDFNNVIVYIHNKIADENIFKDSGNARIANQYLVGEIQADFLHSDDSPITSSRQGLDNSDANVAEFIANLVEIRSFFVAKWSEIRGKTAIKKLPEIISNNQSYKSWFGRLNKQQINIHNKMINIIINQTDYEDMDIEDIKQYIISIVNFVENSDTDAIQKQINKIDFANDNKLYIDLLSKLLLQIKTSSAIKIYNSIKQKLDAINKLKELMSNPNTLEKFFEEHLEEHPWLINPTWNKIMHKESFETFRQAYFKSINKYGEYNKNFIDLLIRIDGEELPIIVEIKRNNAIGHSLVSYTGIYDQAKKYQVAVLQNVEKKEKKYDRSDVKVYFIISENSGAEGSYNKIQFEANELEHLRNQNIHILKYNEIIKTAEDIFGEYIKILKDESKFPIFE